MSKLIEQLEKSQSQENLNSLNELIRVISGVTEEIITDALELSARKFENFPGEELLGFTERIAVTNYSHIDFGFQQLYDPDRTPECPYGATFTLTRYSNERGGEDIQAPHIFANSVIFDSLNGFAQKAVLGARTVYVPLEGKRPAPLVLTYNEDSYDSIFEVGASAMSLEVGRQSRSERLLRSLDAMQEELRNAIDYPPYGLGRREEEVQEVEE